MTLDDMNRYKIDTVHRWEDGAIRCVTLRPLGEDARTDAQLQELGPIYMTRMKPLSETCKPAEPAPARTLSVGPTAPAAPAWTPSPTSSLRPEHIQAAKLAAQGYSVDGIAAQEKCSPRTIQYRLAACREATSIDAKSLADWARVVAAVSG